MPFKNPTETPMAIATATPFVDTETIDVIAPATLQEGSTIEGVVDGITFIATVPLGGVQEGDTFPVPYPSAAKNAANHTNTGRIMVKAPETLMPGDQFNAEVDGIQFRVTVPDGGVSKDDIFEILHPSAATASRGEYLVPNGEWRTGLCDCCDPTRGCCILLLCGSFGNLCLYGQIMQRLKLNLAGFPAKPGTNGHVCRLIVGISFGLNALYYFMVVLQFNAGIFLLYICVIIWSIFLIVAFTRTRRHMREKHNLPANCCKDSGACDDCCTTYFCMCCSAIQMASHTHDRNVYPYSCCSGTGLADHAPEIANSYECCSETDLTTYPPEIV